MITPKKIGKAITKKFKNWRGTTAPKETAIKEPSASSSKDFLKESEENILIVETATERIRSAVSVQQSGLRNNR